LTHGQLHFEGLSSSHGLDLGLHAYGRCVALGIEAGDERLGFRVLSGQQRLLFEVQGTELGLLLDSVRHQFRFSDLGISTKLRELVEIFVELLVSCTQFFA
jgi:hypothetical protein